MSLKFNPSTGGLDLVGMNNPMSTGGDIIYGGASGVPTRLANGSVNQVLTSQGGTAAPIWATPAGGSGITIGTTAITSGTDARILYQDGTVVAQDSTLRWNKTLDYLYVNNTTLSTPGVSNNIFLGTYPTAIVAGGGAANLIVGSGAGATITSGTAITALGVNCCSTATAALFAVGIGFQAFLNATPTRGFAAGGSGQANNAGTDSFSLGSLSMVNATNEVETIMIGTNSGIGCTVGFWNVGIGASTVYAAGGAAYGNVVIGRAAGQTVGGSFAANRNTIVGYTADATAGLTGVIALGAGAIAKTSNTIVIGGTVSAPTRMYIGLGETSATPTSITISPTNGVGTNIAGADLILAASQPTGSGVGGKVKFQTATQGAAGTTLRALVTRLDVDENANIRAYGLHNNATAQGSATNQDIRSGTYTPTRSAETNLDSNVTPSQAQWFRVGNVVTVSGRVTVVDPTLTATATSFELSLPVASNIGAVEDLAGTAFCGTIEGMGAEVTGSVANNTAVFSWIATDVTSQSWSYHYTYEVI
jgi:hypothetical protein